MWKCGPNDKLQQPWLTLFYFEATQGRNTLEFAFILLRRCVHFQYMCLCLICILFVPFLSHNLVVFQHSLRQGPQTPEPRRTTSFSFLHSQRRGALGISLSLSPSLPSLSLSRSLSLCFALLCSGHGVEAGPPPRASALPLNEGALAL